MQKIRIDWQAIRDIAVEFADGTRGASDVLRRLIEAGHLENRPSHKTGFFSHLKGWNLNLTKGSPSESGPRAVTAVKWSAIENRTREIVETAPKTLSRQAVFNQIVDEGLLKTAELAAYRWHCNNDFETLPFSDPRDWAPVAARAQSIMDASAEKLSSKALYAMMRDDLDGVSFKEFRARVVNDHDLDLVRLDCKNNPLKDWTAILEKAANIVNKYDTGVTLRQLFYRLVSLQMLPNTQASYDALGNHVSAVRLADEFPDLIDPSREIEGSWGEDATCFEMPSVAQMLRNAAYTIRLSANTYSLAARYGQEFRIFIGVEKRGLMEQLRAWFADYPVKIVPFGGQTSTTVIKKIRRELDAAGLTDEKCVMVYAGDFDPSGLQIPKSFARLTGCTVHRIALTQAQVNEYGLPRGVVKDKDPNTAAMKKETGELCQVEVDALDPSVLRDLYMEGFNQYWDQEAYDEAREEEEIERKRLRQLVEPMAIEIEAMIQGQE